MRLGNKIPIFLLLPFAFCLPTNGEPGLSPFNYR
jgi:hypothetical protein